MLLQPANPYILDVKSDIVNQRLYFLTTGKMPIFLQSECWQLQTDISRRENGAHVRIRILPAWHARGSNRNGSTRETLSWCRLQIIIIIMMIMTMTMIMIMVINYNNDRGFWFSDIWFLTLNSLPIYSSTPLAMTFEIAWTNMCCFLHKLTQVIPNENKTSRHTKECSNFLLSFW